MAFRVTASLSLLLAAAALSAQTPSPTVTPYVVPGDPICGQFGVLGCPFSSRTASLTSADCPLGDGSFYDLFRFSGTAGQTVTVRMSSAAFDTFLFVLDPGGNLAATDDDSGGGLNSRLVFTLPATGAWTVLANSYDANQFGPYQLSLECAGGIGVTATPLPGSAPSDIPTLSFFGLIALSFFLAAAALAVMRRSA